MKDDSKHLDDGGGFDGSAGPRVTITKPQMTPEVSDLRDAVIALADAYYSRRDQDLVVAAFRRVANDTSKPFSEEAVTASARRDIARLEKYDELVDKLARNYYDTSGSISSVDAVKDTIKELIALHALGDA